MKSALLIIDVQQGLCEGDGQAFESAALTNISCFGPRARNVPCAAIQP